MASEVTEVQQEQQVQASEASQPDEVKPYDGGATYDTRAFGELGWEFVNAGEQYRKLKNVSKEDALMICGIFKQATMGDCKVEEPKKGEVEITQRNEWLKHTGIDHIDAMKLYIDKVKELAKIYEAREEKASQDGA